MGAAIIRGGRETRISRFSSFADMQCRSSSFWAGLPPARFQAVGHVGTENMSAEQLLSWAGLFLSVGLVASVIFALV
jgi:hypothetical protein